MINKLLIQTAAAFLLVALPALPQAFSSGSSGVDGALTYATGLGEVIFDPIALNLDTDLDNVYNFTTITIGSGTTLRLRADKMRNPSAVVVFLASGNVVVNGNINADGEAGKALNSTSLPTFLLNRTPSVPGPGGYPGGLGARVSVAPESGGGPGGGPAGAISNLFFPRVGGSAAHQGVGQSIDGNGSSPFSISTYGNFQLTPMFGGSGGGGGWGDLVTRIGGTGGAGGGAIRIVSTTSITIVGTISALGGDGGPIAGPNFGAGGGAASGGAIHLIAPSIPNAANLIAYGGLMPNTGSRLGGTGYVRLSTNTQNPPNSSNPTAILGPLFAPPLPTATPLPAVRIVSVNNVNAPSNPQGNYLLPDVQINSGTAVNVAISASNIPLGTVVKLRLASEQIDTIIDCAGLAGTIASSTATCSATFPFSVSIANLRASW